jgi:hypothetical protein
MIPKQEKKLESIFQKIANVCSLVMKYSGIIIIVLLAVRLLGEWLGWIKIDNPPVIDEYPERPY